MFIKVFFFFLLLNTTIGALELWIGDLQAEGAPNALINPINNASLNYIEGVDFANRTQFDNIIYLRNDDDNNGTLSGQIRNPQNATGDSADIFNEQQDIDAFEVWGFVRFFNGGFVLNTIDRFTGAIGMDLPTGFVDSISVVIGFIFILFMFFVITGRSFSSFT